MPDFPRVLPDEASVADAIASATASELSDVLSKYARASLCVTASGPFPAAYALIASHHEIEWDRVHLFWTNDQIGTSDGQETAFEVIRRCLIDPAGIPTENVNAISKGLSAETAARRYEADLEVFFGADGAYFDVMHLGIAPDGSTAGLHPDSEALNQRERRAFPTRSAGAVENDGVTLTLRVLNRAECCIIAATGKDVAQAVAGAFGSSTPADSGSPASRIRTGSGPRWFVDRAAASGLKVADLA